MKNKKLQNRIENRILNKEFGIWNRIHSIFYIPSSTFHIKGFTLLELLLVIAILAVLSVAGAASYRSFGTNTKLNSVTRTLAAEIKQAQSNAMIGKNNLKWGVHFVNSTNDYYLIFSTPDFFSNVATVIISTTTLPTGISFSDPISNASKDVIFNKISGNTIATTTTLVTESLSKTISISAIGTIDYQ
ncbi:MAG: prepilin-type N-terminal cleavage/methylation domain-containing protein [Candidatus Nomurabacteria bacterium]|nr:prepilin-type N-terminal cleavage/methylation domain-containing protein [Candidatus Nomurabacteria bacterium]